jgi:2'-5' RNA ligase superfamily
MLPGDRLIVAFLRPRTVDTAFERWPLHITIVPWFRSKVSTTELQQKLVEAYANIGPFSTSVGPEEQFGYHAAVTVNVLAIPNGFEHLQERTVKVLEELAIPVVAHHWDPNDFRAHIHISRVNMWQKANRYSVIVSI